MLIVVGLVGGFSLIHISKKRYAESFERMLKYSIPVQVRDIKYDSSLFKTKISLEANLEDGSDLLPFQIEVNADHIPGFSSQGPYLLKQTLVLTPKNKTAELAKSVFKEPVKMNLTTVALFSGEISNSLHLAPLNHITPGLLSIEKGFNIDFSFDENRPRKFNISIPSFAYDAKGTKVALSDGILKTDLADESNGARFEWNIAVQSANFEDGTNKGSIKELQFSNRLKGIDLTTVGEIIATLKKPLYSPNSKLDREKLNLLLSTLVEKSQQLDFASKLALTGEFDQTNSKSKSALEKLSISLSAKRNSQKLDVISDLNFASAKTSAYGIDLPLRHSEAKFNLVGIKWPFLNSAPELAMDQSSSIKLAINISDSDMVASGEANLDAGGQVYVKPTPTNINAKASVEIKNTFLDQFPTIKPMLSNYFKKVGDTYKSSLALKNGKTVVNDLELPQLSH